ncbi:hypothetical protein HMPREF1340_01974, partial [Enterococcus faecalis ERV73]
LDGVVYCLPGMQCELIKQSKKYHTFRRIEKNKSIEFKVEKDLVSAFFKEGCSYE